MGFSKKSIRFVGLVGLLVITVGGSIDACAGGATAVDAAVGEDQLVVRALGDSVTARYGFLGDGTPKKLGDLANGEPHSLRSDSDMNRSRLL